MPSIHRCFLSAAYLRCPNCNSTDLKEGFSPPTRKDSSIRLPRTRLRAVGVGGSGPDFIIGKATTRGFHQSVLSKRLSPPVKWSYRKLILWWVVVSRAGIGFAALTVMFLLLLALFENLITLCASCHDYCLGRGLLVYDRGIVSGRKSAGSST